MDPSRLTTTLHPHSILTPEAATFIEEWLDSDNFITARTSGSTGAPKEIRLLKSDMRSSAQATNDFFGIGPGSTLALPLSPVYIAGKMQIVRALEARCRLIAEVPSSRPLEGLDTAPGTIDMIPVVPSQLEGLLDSPHLPRVRNVIIGGAPLSAATEGSVIKSGMQAWATYGMTETCSHVALRRLGDDTYAALPGISFSADPRGCLVIHSSRMSFGTLVTNDIVELVSPSAMRWLGRYDNVINSGGIKIHPEEVERIISPLLPPDARFYITSRPHPKWGQEVVMIAESSCTLPPGILDSIREALPPRHAPKAIITVPELPRTPGGKLLRRNCF